MHTSTTSEMNMPPPDSTRTGSLHLSTMRAMLKKSHGMG
eukprot:CAMPEP_0181280930 /NCGR_PEP_ID=MMETSP1097-20121128/13256_1 /TAXON_ID=35684 /ORGANISM="Pseudopedinella elastica, Strain CCMP716" /LENGTH=38 /DNA_ID= /DNA_START= /DNA_END= /DNA_ORIENTATION=